MNIFFNSKKLVQLVIIFLFLMAPVACQHETPLQDLQGNFFQLADYKGKWIIINYWASWCRPCYQEIPELNAFAQKHLHDAVVFGVNFDQEPRSKLLEQVKKMSIRFAILLSDPAKQLGIQEVPGLPTTYLINPAGKLVQTLTGIQTQKSLEKAIALAALR